MRHYHLLITSSISKYCFLNCYKVSDILLPNSLKYINDRAIIGASSLTNL
ncbi:MAG: hypothetical protein ACTTID_03275 [Bacillales bacterium]